MSRGDTAPWWSMSRRSSCRRCRRPTSHLERPTADRRGEDPRLPAIATEQYPQGLGRRGRVGPAAGTRSGEAGLQFGDCPELFRRTEGPRIHKILVCGAETHVCVQQTCWTCWLTAAGVRGVDAVGSRFESTTAPRSAGWIHPGNADDHRSGLSSGARSPARGVSRQISRLAKETR